MLADKQYAQLLLLAYRAEEGTLTEEHTVEILTALGWHTTVTGHVVSPPRLAQARRLRRAILDFALPAPPIVTSIDAQATIGIIHFACFHPNEQRWSARAASPYAFASGPTEVAARLAAILRSASKPPPHIKSA